MSTLEWMSHNCTHRGDTLERIQKSAFRIILGQNYVSYNKSLEYLKLDTLADRRKQLCLSFARKASKDSKFKVWFSNLTKPTRTDPSFALPRTRTAAYEKSPLVYLTKLLNIQ